mmetsp:Transcript_7959/g.14987  ORF Transcript_7959/g.14987 Transcript_7959/m.14987 type:complete len:406 (+) Transcript_7959:51-1268(+)
MPRQTQILTSIAATLAVTAALAFLKQRKSTNKDHHEDDDSSYFVMVGDIGGTNTRLAMYKPGESTALFEKEYLNSKHITDNTKSFENEIFCPFLTSSNINFDGKVIVACFAVAGPVKDNCVIMTNLGKNMNIKLDGNAIEASTKGHLGNIKKCKIINDFVGQGYGLLDLNLDKEVVELIPGSRERMDPTGPKACLGAGTGLGECYLTTSSLHPEEEYECFASEGGHADYTPRTEVQVDLLRYLKSKYEEPNRVSIERVVSGKGLANVFEFLAKTYPEKTRQDILEEFKVAKDMQGRVVGINANADVDPCPLCVESMEIMMSAYGAEASNCAVKFIPTGGLYVSGGLTPKNIKFIKGMDSAFMKAYKDKGRLSDLVNSIPLFAVLVEDLGLRGARVCATRELQNMR